MDSKDTALKGGNFILEMADPANMFITEDFDEEAKMISELVIDFCIKEIQEPFFQKGRELEVTNEADKKEVLGILKKAGELGLCGVSIPEAYGGMGLDFKTNTLISNSLSYGYSFATTLGAQTSIGCLPLVYYGTEAQKQKYLPKIASAEYVAAYALTEPEAGSDANSGKAKAILSEDGKHYLLSGQKIWITNGGFADVYTVFAKIDDDEDLSAFIVERSFEGFSVGKEEKKFGIKGSSTVPLFFDNCKVPVENLLGERAGGFKIALTILNGGRIKAGAGAVGGTKNALSKAIEYANERKQFEKAIGEFGAIQYKIGNLAMQVFANEAASFRVADLIDRKEQELLALGVKENEAKIKATAEFAIEASLIKVKGTELVCFALDEVMQIYGGMGYAVETGVGMGYRDARITKIYEGTNDINAMLSIGELSKRALKTKELDLISAGKKIPAFILANSNPFRSRHIEAQQLRAIQGLKYSFLYLLGITGRHFKKEIIDEQEIILNLSYLLQEAFVCDSAYLRIQKLAAKEGHNAALFELQKKMFQLYLYEALEKTRKAANETIDSFAEGSKRKKHRRMLKRLLPSLDINPKQMRREIAQDLLEKGSFYF